MNSVSALCVAAVLISLTHAEVVPVKDCGSKLGTTTQVDITPCPSIPCPFKRNTNVSVTINFNANYAITSAQTSVHGDIAGVLVPFPIPDSDACHFMTCPISQGSSAVYKNAIFVQQAYPKITLIVKWELLSGSDDITCFTVPVTITD
ncbi:unnamed protein product [Lymnaea stagnalis]|uniref:MD-2-related lipid-recognition domain-containing protein n=1 Tax=Lymnaea stagnalis TaxID=6523 RepID=A0AAV2HWQ5_LYMST